MNLNIKYSKLYRLSAALLIVLAIIISVLFEIVYTPSVSYAEESNYSNVLDDLQSDADFNVNDYPADSEDFSLSVIQIAESEDNELFVYVYQPYTGSVYDLTGTRISMSLFEWNTSDSNYMVYSLTLINESGVFQKYKVDSFIVSSDNVRYYDISTIYRNFISNIDEETDDDNTIDMVAYEVAECWAASTAEDGSVSYEMQRTEVVEITDMHIGFVRYDDGYEFWSGSSNNVDGHFIAFSTDYDIDTLYEVDISFITRAYYATTQTVIGSGTTREVTYYDDDYTYYYNPLTLTYDDTVSIDVSGFLWFHKEYTWNRIDTVDTFLSDEDENLTDETKTAISDMQYVVRFYETEFTIQTSTSLSATVINISATNVKEVSILRLKFAVAGKTYNLGVVCDVQTGDSVPDGSDSYTASDLLDDVKDKFYQNLKKILKIVFLLIFIVALLPFIPYIVKLLVWLIKLPFKLLGTLFKAIKNLFSSNKKE